MGKTLFEDYDGFVEKFKPKKTTDDCYTPQYVYDCVLQHVRERVNPLEGMTIRRPFWPGGNYQAEAEGYGPTDVVVDNPPFSILAQIVDFYLLRGIKFYLFAPGLTLFNILRRPVTAVVADADITYANGAVVSTSFVTNLYAEDYALVVDGELNTKLREAQRKTGASATPAYTYPDNVVSAARLGKVADQGVSFSVLRSQAAFIRRLDAQRASGKAIYGGGLLLSDGAAAKAAAAAAKAPCIVYELSEAERMAVAELSKNDPKNND